MKRVCCDQSIVLFFHLYTKHLSQIPVCDLDDRISNSLAPNNACSNYAVELRATDTNLNQSKLTLKLRYSQRVTRADTELRSHMEVVMPALTRELRRNSDTRGCGEYEQRIDLMQKWLNRHKQINSFKLYNCNEAFFSDIELYIHVIFPIKMIIIRAQN